MFVLTLLDVTTNYNSHPFYDERLKRNLTLIKIAPLKTSLSYNQESVNSSAPKLSFYLC